MSFSEDKEVFSLIQNLILLEARLNPDSGKELGEIYGKRPKTLMIAGERERIDAKHTEVYFRLVEAMIESDRVTIRKSPNKIQARVVRDLFLPKFNPMKHWDRVNEEILGFHEDCGILERGEFLNNYYSLSPPYVNCDARIPQKVINAYKEAAYCYVYGMNYSVFCMARTVIESILRFRLKIDDSNNVPLKNVVIEASNKKFFNEKMKWKIEKITRTANGVLHRGKSVTKEQAKEALDILLEFIEDTY